jgi:RND family efflux transporter MFP subunit
VRILRARDASDDRTARARRGAGHRPGRGGFWLALVLTAAAVMPASAQTAGTPPTVPVIKPKTEAVTNYVELTGNAASVQSVKLIARVGGYLEEQRFHDGAFVKKGDLLFKIQQDQYKAQLQQAQSQVMAAKAAIVYARTEVMRYRELVKKEAAAQIQVDHWVYELASAQAKLLDAEAQVVIAKLNLDYTEVRAPFDGQMTKALIDPGNVVGTPGQPAALADIMLLDPIYVVANLSEQDVLKIRANLNQQRLNLAQLVKVPIEVGLQDESGFSRRGTLEYVSPGIDPATGTLLVRGVLPNPNRDLLPGFFVRIRLPMERSARNALLVPDRALQSDQGGRYLLVVNNSDIVEKRYVQLGEVFDGLRAITSGLNPEDRVIVGELWRTSPGSKVVPQMTTTAPPGSPQ